MELTLRTASTVGDYLRAAVLRDLDSDLVSPNCLVEILEIAAAIPGGLTNFFGFECPLDSPTGHADFLVCTPSEGGRNVLAGEIPESQLPPEFQDHSVWRRVFDFAKRWNDPQSPLFTKVHNMWLEFDIEGKSKAIPVPSVFFGARGLERPATEGPGAAQGIGQWLTGIALPCLRGEDLSPNEQAVIARCIEVLPAGAYIFQVGLMLARPARATRLCVRGIPAGQIVHYLQQAGWQGPAGELTSLVDTLAGNVQSFSVDLDVGDQVQPKIGLECYPGTEVENVNRLLEHLVSTGLAQSKKAHAIERWRAFVHERLNRDVWPRDLLATSAFLGGRMHSVFYRRLHHVKVIHDPGKPLCAKAYLAVQHFWIEPKTIREAFNNMALRESSAGNGEPCAPAC